MNSPSVLIVGNFLSGYGLATGVCEELAQRIHNLGWRIRTTSRWRSRPLRILDMLFTVWRYRNEYDVAQMDVFSGPSFRWAEAVCWLLRRIRCPYVLTLHGGALPEFAEARELRVKNLLHSAAAVTVPSRYLLGRMAKYRSDLLLIPNALDTAAYQRQRRSSLQPRLLWLRAFHKIYAPEIAVKAIARLKGDYPSLRLTMVGADKGDNSRAMTQALARTYGVEAHLEVLEPVPKAIVPGLLGTADIFLNTSRVDNTPVSVLEALASGMCVVSTEAGGIPFLLKSKENALLVPVDDDAAMAAAIRLLLTDKALAARLQEAALTLARAHDWSVVLPQWQSLLFSKARPASRRFVSESIPEPARPASP
jgi:glycosyltransferase involved in cell wall biosynthesis